MTKLDFYADEYAARSSGFPYGISAGGVVYRKIADNFEFLLLGRNTEKGTNYHLPKGALHIGETLESCAVREITEETGVNVTLKTYLGGKQATFEFMGTYNDKIIHYYAAEYISEAEPMDNEHDFSEWVSYDDAVTRLQSHVKREDTFITRCKEYLDKL